MGLTKRAGSRFYDGKILWEQYMSMGKAASYTRLQKWCIANGMVNPASGKTSHAGPRFAMWRYAVKNPEEAYVSYQKWQQEYGLYPSFEEFCLDLYDHSETTKQCIVSYKEREKFKEKYIMAKDLLQT